MIGLIDVGGTKLLAAVAGDDGVITAPIRRDTPDADPAATLIEMLDEVRHGERLAGIALAVPGPFTRDPAAIVNPPGMPAGWWNLNLALELGQHYGCEVAAENDANCAALAEALSGAGAGQGTVVYLTVSTGIGTGIVRDGHLIYGRQDTEGGHMVMWPEWLGGPPCECGGHGCLEALASGRAIEARFGRPAAEIEDPAVWDEVGRWLGLAIVNLSVMFDPHCVVLGGGVVQAWDRFADSLIRTVDGGLHLVERPLIRRAELGDDRNLHGALRLFT